MRRTGDCSIMSSVSATNQFAAAAAGMLRCVDFPQRANENRFMRGLAWTGITIKMGDSMRLSKRGLIAAATSCALLPVMRVRSEAQDAPITITWLANTTQSPHATAAPIRDWYQSRIDAWSKQHPNVKVDISYLGTDINAAMTRLQEQVTSGRAPDFSSLDSFFLQRFFPNLQPLDALVPDADDFVLFVRNGMHGPDGKLKALWVNTDVRALFYRTDLVPTPPKTWDELLAQSADLAKKNVTPYLFPGGRGEASVMEHLPMFWAMGGSLVDDAGKPVFGQGANRDNWIKILHFLKQTVTTGASPARVVNYRFEAEMYPDILRGNVAMFLGGSWMPKQLHDLGDKAQWTAAPIPMPGAVGPSTAAGGWTYGVFTPDPAKQKLIVNLINFIAAGPDGMIGAVSAQGNLPTRISVGKSAAPYMQAPNTRQFVSMLGYGRIRPPVAVYPTISTALQIAISDVISGQKTPEAAIDQAWQDVQQQAGK
jgi:multiple sugar transport system substrate-binding protein